MNDPDKPAKKTALPKNMGRDEFLPKASSKALEHLSMNENGFILMVQGAQIDLACHDGDVVSLIQEKNDQDDALGTIMDFVEKDGQTIVIVFADQETVGLDLVPKDNGMR